MQTFHKTGMAAFHQAIAYGTNYLTTDSIKRRSAEHTYYYIFSFANQIEKYYFFGNNIMHNLKIGLKFV